MFMILSADMPCFFSILDIRAAVFPSAVLTAMASGGAWKIVRSLLK